MNKIKILILAIITLFGIENAGAQAVKVYKKDGTSLIVPYSRLDKIITRTQPVEWVDLGLPSGILWATENVGADYPEDYGSFFAWGETSPKDTYDMGNSLNYGKDVPDFSGNYVYDAATAAMGVSARTPTMIELLELTNCCTVEEVTVHGVKGWKYTGINGNSIFLPLAGVRNGDYYIMSGTLSYYMGSTPDEGRNDVGYMNMIGDLSVTSLFDRSIGVSVRPVSGVNMQLGDATGISDTSADIPVTFAHVPSGGVKAGIEYSVGKDVKKVYADVKADGTMTIKIEGLETETAYQYRAFAEWNGVNLFSHSKEFKTKLPLKMPEGMEWVDLGLPSGIKWASVNIGARTPGQYGAYFAWGELDTKEEYIFENSLLSEKDLSDFSGNDEYDAAAANWGAASRMPTQAEFEELSKNCLYEWITLNGIKCIKLTGPNGKSITLPIAGEKFSYNTIHVGEMGYYWTSTPASLTFSDPDNNQAACQLFHNEITSADKNTTIPYFRLTGLPIRPVSGVNMQLGDATNIEGMSADIPVTFAHVPSDGVKAGIEYSIGEEVKKVYADVKADGEVTIKLENLADETTYQYRAFTEWNGGYLYTQSKEFSTIRSLKMPVDVEWVDLGLPSGIKWASVNIGAKKPEQYGEYFAWGELSPKDTYTQENSLTYNKPMTDISGNVLYDAATANWGANYRMPTKEEIEELADNTNCEWTTKNGVKGIKAVGPNGNSIFLPASGIRKNDKQLEVGNSGEYWCSVPHKDFSANMLYLDEGTGLWRHSDNRSSGLTIRPVSGVNMQLGDAMNIEGMSADIPVTFAHVPSDGVKAGIEYSIGEEVKKVYADVKADGEVIIKLENLADETTYQYRAFTEWNGGYLYTQSKEFSTIRSLKMPEDVEWVDLGLPSGIKWASVNIGATKPEQYGEYFAWGELSPKDTYTQENSLTYNKPMTDISGNVLYDAATANWGANYRMPTKAEMDELYNNCHWVKTMVNGIKCFKVEASNGNSIILPATGIIMSETFYNVGNGGFYWTSTPDVIKENEAYRLSFFDYGDLDVFYDKCYIGLTIRPVSGVNMQLGAAKNITYMSADIPVTFAHVPSDGVKTGIEYNVGEEVKKVYADVKADGEVIIKLENLADETTYQYRAFTEWNGGFIYSQSKEFTTKYSQWVDLGLPSGTKWAKFNVGATAPEQYGDYFAWGEITTKEAYLSSNSLTTNMQLPDISGNAQYDAATSIWGSSARMPTKEEMDELINNCTFNDITVNGIAGKQVIGPNGRSIFLPYAGEYDVELIHTGFMFKYWTSTPAENNLYNAYLLEYDLNETSVHPYYREMGYPIRPVYKP